MSVMPYPWFAAGIAVWLMSVIVAAQYSLKKSIDLTIGGVLFSRVIQFLYSSEYIPHRLIYRVECRARVGCANEEASREGLETIGGMPVCGHLLPIIFAIYGCCFAILLDEPVEHVEEDGVRLFHVNWLVHLAN